MTRLSVWIIVTDPAENVLLGKRRQGRFAGRWILVGGGIQENEPFERTAYRQVQKETGLVVTVDPRSVCIITRPADAEKPRREIHVHRAYTSEIQPAITGPGGDINEMRFFAPEALPWDDMTEYCRDALRSALRRSPGNVR